MRVLSCALVISLVLGTFASGGGGSFEEECDHDFEQCDEAMQIREVFSMSPNEGSTTGGTRVTLTGAGFSQDFLNGGNSVYFADDDGNLAAECEVLQGSCTEECTTSSTLICDTKATAASGKLTVHVKIDGSFSAQIAQVSLACFATVKRAAISCPWSTSAPSKVARTDAAGAKPKIISYGPSYMAPNCARALF